MIRLSLCFLIVSMLISENAFAGKLYKWTDQNGKTHYSDSPVKAINPGDVEVKRSLKRPFKLSLPRFSNSAVQVKINRGQKLDTIFPAAPPLDPDCVNQQNPGDSGTTIVNNQNCATQIEVQNAYEQKRQARIKEFFVWKDKQDRANQDELAKLEQERYLVNKEIESLKNLKEDKTVLRQPGNVTTSNPLTIKNQRDLAFQKDLLLQREFGNSKPLALPVYSNPDIQTRLKQGDIMDDLFPAAPPLPPICSNTELIPNATNRLDYQRRCRNVLEEKQTYEKEKLDRIREYFAWRDNQSEQTRNLSPGANQTQLDRMQQERDLLRKDKEQLENLRFEVGVQR